MLGEDINGRMDSMMKCEQRKGVTSALIAALLFGVSTPLAKLAIAVADPVLVAGLLYLGSGFGLAVVRAFRSASGTERKETPLSPNDLPWLAGGILAGGVAGPIFLLLGLLTTTGSAASLLLNLEAVATASIAWIVFGENVDKRIFFGFVLILFGGILLSVTGGQHFAISSGAVLIAAACLFWGIDNNLTRKISGSDPYQIAMWKGFVAGAVNISIALCFGSKLPALSIVGGSAAIGFFGYGLSLVLFVRALRHLGTARTGAYFSTAPFAGAALAFAVGQGHADWRFLTACILMLAGVWLHLTERHEHPHVHDFHEHDHLHVHDEHHQHAHRPDDPPCEPHAHLHRHEPVVHSHPHYPDTHHRHDH